MKTYMPKAEDIERSWFVVDATGVPLGRLASEVAKILRGKHKPTFTPHLDMGDYVVITNAEKVVLTGKKWEEKVYYHHSNYPGGLKATVYKEMAKKFPERVVELAVRRMLPQNKLGRKTFKKLKVYRGENHPHTGQKPEKIEVQKYREEE